MENYRMILHLQDKNIYENVDRKANIKFLFITV